MSDNRGYQYQPGDFTSGCLHMVLILLFVLAFVGIAML